MTTRNHGIACDDIVVESVEKKQCHKGRGHKALEILRGDNAICNGCLVRRKEWAGNNPEKIWELSRTYGEEHEEEKKLYKQEK